jgi:hypothetical protein
MERSLDALMELDEETLFQELGREVVHFLGAPLTPKQLESIAKRWLQGKTEFISKRICTSDKVYELINSQDYSKELILAICDLIVEIQFGISPLLVAVLIVKGGLNKICEAYWRA